LFASVSLFICPFLFVSVQRRSDVAPTFRAEVARPALAAGRARHEHVRVRGTNGRARQYVVNYIFMLINFTNITNLP
jgi:hypothetical protein